jgi:hypothetical protein
MHGYQRRIVKLQPALERPAIRQHAHHLSRYFVKLNVLIPGAIPALDCAGLSSYDVSGIKTLRGVTDEQI